MTRKLEGKIAVVTGGSSGIGLAAAREFVAEGAYVFITGRRKPELDAAVAEIGANVVAVQADSAKVVDLDRLYATVKATKGRIDVLFANAGGGSFEALGAISEENFDDTFGRNVKGVVFAVQKALPLLSDGASVILTGSTTGSMGTASFSIYSATKAAVRNLARSWILDLKGRRIRVNVLSPGPTRTPGILNIAGPEAAKQQDFLDALAAMVPLGRVAEPEEIAKAALFLACDDSSFVNGAELFVDGGLAQV